MLKSLQINFIAVLICPYKANVCLIADEIAPRDWKYISFICFVYYPLLVMKTWIFDLKAGSHDLETTGPSALNNQAVASSIIVFAKNYVNSVLSPMASSVYDRFFHTSASVSVLS